MKQYIWILVAATSMMIVSANDAAEIGTAFTYQGTLENGSGPVTDTCDFRFGLWDASAGGNQVGASPQTVALVDVESGVFTVTLDFGADAVDGTARWLAIEVKCPGDAGFVLLSPRVELTPAPHALALPGLYTQENSTSPNVIGGYSGNTVVTGVVGATIAGGGREDGEPPFGLPGRHWVGGPYGTVGGGRNNIAGTTIDAAHATVAGGLGNVASRSVSTVGGGVLNGASEIGSTVGGGGSNSASGSFSTVAGGNTNVASAMHSTASGGLENTAGVHGECSNSFMLCTSDAECPGGLCIAAATIGGGYSNSVSGPSGTVGGGFGNTAGGRACEGILAPWSECDSDADCAPGTCAIESGTFATVAGGHDNKALDRAATVGGGHRNTAIGSYSTVGGGHSNTATGGRATVAGGFGNRAVAFLATVPGGEGNVAGGVGSFAAGTSAEVRDSTITLDSDGDEGTFVWSDSTTVLPNRFTSTGPNQFLINATGGVGIGTNNPQNPLAVEAPGTTMGGGGLSEVVARFKNTTSATHSAVSIDALTGRDSMLFLSENGSVVWDVRNDSSAGDMFQVRYQVGGVNSTKLTIDSSGNVGINTTEPEAALHIVGGNVQLDDFGSAPVFLGRRAGGTVSSPSAALSGNILGQFGGAGYNGLNGYSGIRAYFDAVAAEDFSTTAQGAYLRFLTTPAGTTSPAERMRIASTGNVGINLNNPQHPLHVGTNNTNGNGAHLTAGGTWTNGSSRDFKENFEPIDKKEILQKLVDLPVTQWQYKNEGDMPNLHIGPVAEDFRSAFGLGHDERYITTIDADGVALAAIQGLHQIVQEKDCEISDLKSDIEELRLLVKDLADRQCQGDE